MRISDWSSDVCSSDLAEIGCAGAADLGFIEGDLENPLLAQIPVPGDRLLLVVGPRHPWASAQAVTPADLKQAAWVLREKGSGTRQNFELGLRQFGVDPAGINVALDRKSTRLNSSH